MDLKLYCITACIIVLYLWYILQWKLINYNQNLERELLETDFQVRAISCRIVLPVVKGGSTIIPALKGLKKEGVVHAIF